jgi:molybdopterin molybdotransferase
MDEGRARRLLAPEEAVRLVLAHTTPLEARTTARGLTGGWAVIAAPVVVDRDLPALDVSRMDGYAVLAPLKAGARLWVRRQIKAGDDPGTALAAGEAARIFTGAPLPPQANAVVEQEAVAGPDAQGYVEVQRAVLPGEHVTRRGSVASAGRLVPTEGRPLAAGQVALLAAMGQLPTIYAVPRLAIISTGHEVVPESAQPLPHQVRDSAGPAVAAAASSLGVEVAARTHVPDDLPQLTATLRRFLDDPQVHAVLTIGSVSVGDYDLVPAAVQAAGGRVVFHRLAAKPGRPSLFAVCDGGTLIFGLPGNPLSALVGFFELAAPALRKMAHRPPPWLPTLAVRLTAPVAGDPERTVFAPAQVWQEQGTDWLAQPLPTQHSADLVAAAQADGVLIVPVGTKELPAGEVVPFRPWRPLW